MAGSTYVIYYGWLTDDAGGEPNGDAREIAAVQAPLLIAHCRTAGPGVHANLNPQVLALMHEAGTAVFAYVATNFGKAPPGDVSKVVASCLAAGVDGVFFDETDALREVTHFEYYQALARLVREAGKGVIVNPGVAQCGERIMEVADRVMVEHRWRDLRLGSLWSFRYPAQRFMGVSSNEEHAMGYCVDEQRAVADTLEAWRAGIGWHAATDRYVELPHWFAAYVRAVNSDATRLSP